MDDRCNWPARLSSGTRRHSADCNPDYQRQSAGGCTVWRTESAHPAREVKLRMARYSFWIGSQGSRAQRGALLALAAILLCAICAPLLAPHNPIEQYRDVVKLPPAWYAGGSWRFALGTDEAGRDILSRLIYGARLSFWISAISVFIAIFLGTVLRLAGYADHAFNRCPACTAFPVAVDCGDCDSWAGPDEYDVCDCIGRPAGLCAAGARLRARRAAKGICDCIARCGRGHPTADVFTSAAQLRRAVDRAGDARLFNRRSGCGRVGFSWHRRAAAARRVGLDARERARLYG